MLTRPVRLGGEGAGLIAAIVDATGPSVDGLQPATGAMAAVDTAATRISLYRVTAPMPLMMRTVPHRIDAHVGTTVRSGSRRDADGRSGLEVGSRTILVLTGSTQVEGMFRDPCRAGVARDGIGDPVPRVEQLTPLGSRELDEDRSVRIVGSCRIPQQCLGTVTARQRRGLRRPWGGDGAARHRGARRPSRREEAMTRRTMKSRLAPMLALGACAPLALALAAGPAVAAPEVAPTGQVAEAPAEAQEATQYLVVGSSERFTPEQREVEDRTVSADAVAASLTSSVGLASAQTVTCDGDLSLDRPGEGVR